MKFACDNNFTTHVLLTNRRDHIDFKISIKKESIFVLRILRIRPKFSPLCVIFLLVHAFNNVNATSNNIMLKSDALNYARSHLW